MITEDVKIRIRKNFDELKRQGLIEDYTDLTFDEKGNVSLRIIAWPTISMGPAVPIYICPLCGPFPEEGGIPFKDRPQLKKEKCDCSDCRKVGMMPKYGRIQMGQINSTKITLSPKPDPEFQEDKKSK